MGPRSYFVAERLKQREQEKIEYDKRQDAQANELRLHRITQMLGGNKAAAMEKIRQTTDVNKPGGSPPHTMGSQSF
mgnify:CR=1 FL=1